MMTGFFALHVPHYAEGSRVPSGPANPVDADSDLFAARTAVPGGHHSAEHLARHVAAHRELCQSARHAAALSGRSREPPNSARDRRGHWLLHFTLRDQTAQQDPHARPLRRLPLHGTSIHLHTLCSEYSTEEITIRFFSYVTAHFVVHYTGENTVHCRVVQTCGSGTKFGFLGQNFCIHFVLT